MPSTKPIGIAVVATLVAASWISAVHAQNDSESTSPVAVSRTATAPDDTQISSDLTGHYDFGGLAAFGVGADQYDSIESTVIRTSVRKGDVLELRVSSLFYQQARRDNPLEVDSILTYRVDGDRWALQGVRTERAETMPSGESNRSGEPC